MLNLKALILCVLSCTTVLAAADKSLVSKIYAFSGVQFFCPADWKVEDQSNPLYNVIYISRPAGMIIIQIFPPNNILKLKGLAGEFSHDNSVLMSGVGMNVKIGKLFGIDRVGKWSGLRETSSYRFKKKSKLAYARDAEKWFTIITDYYTAKVNKKVIFVIVKAPQESFKQTLNDWVLLRKTFR